jgi:hypothetical protein
VFGGVERGSGRTFLETVNDRSADTLIELIKKWIRPGTTVITDCWAAYRSLPDEGFTHLRVNHSITFVDEDTGAHTNTIKSTWKHVKATLNHTIERWRMNSSLQIICSGRNAGQKAYIHSASLWKLLHPETGAKLKNNNIM